MKAPLPSPEQVLADPAFGELLAFVVARTGLAWYEREAGTLALHAAQRIAACGAGNCARYLARLQDAAAEMDALVALLTVGETYFFRHTEAFTALREFVLPQLLERNRDRRTLRIWSAGCANGSETYSLAILLRSAFGAALQGWDVAITGTDINRQALAQAQTARFGAWALRSVAPEVTAACFTPAGELQELRPEYRTWVSFRYGNLAVETQEDGDPCAQDLVLCRNVMIYFDAGTIGRTAARLHQSLSPGGWLLLGPSDHDSAGLRGFQPVARPGVTLYRRAEAAGAPAPQPQAPPAAVRIGRSLPQAMPWSTPVLPELPPTRTAPVRTTLPRPKTPPLADAEQVRALADRGAYAWMLQESDRILREAPGDATVHYYRALVLGHLDRQDEREQALRNAIYLDRGHVLAHYELAQQLRARGDRDGALRALRNAQRLLAERVPAERLQGEDVTAGELARLVEAQLAAHAEAPR